MCHSLKAPDGLDVAAVRESLKTWLLREGMSLHNCIQWFSTAFPSSSCYERATATLPKKCGLGVTVKALKKTSFSLTTVSASVGGKNFRKEPKVVALETTGQFAGASSGNFKGGTHWVLLIHYQALPKPFCVVYDPDVSATSQAVTAWDECKKLGDVEKEIAFGGTAFEKIVTKMILGEGTELGPLIRYYYGT